jgi:hypothetical protein
VTPGGQRGHVHSAGWSRHVGDGSFAGISASGLPGERRAFPTATVGEVRRLRRDFHDPAGRPAEGHTRWRQTGPVGAGYADRPHVFLPLTWHSGCLLDVVESLVTGFRLVLRILDAEDVGGPLVRGVSMPVDKAAGRSPPVIGEMSIRNGAIDGPSRSWGDLLCPAPVACLSWLRIRWWLRLSWPGCGQRTPGCSSC